MRAVLDGAAVHEGGDGVADGHLRCEKKSWQIGMRKIGGRFVFNDEDRWGVGAGKEKKRERDEKGKRTRQCSWWKPSTT